MKRCLPARQHFPERKQFAKKLEETMIETGRMNVDVTPSGKNYTVLTIKWALASKVTSRDLDKSGLIEKAKGVGFKKVIFTDGWDFGCQWDL